MKSVFLSMLFCAVTFVEGLSQYVWHPPSQDKQSWQRLNLWLGAIFYRTVKQSSIDWDSSLSYVSHSLSLSRLSIAGEGVDDPALFAESKWFDKANPAEGIGLLSQTKGTKHTQLLILLGAYYAFQPDYPYQKDSVEYFLRKAIAESKTTNEQGLDRQALCLLGKMYAQQGDTVNGKAIFKQLIDECEKKDEWCWIAGQFYRRETWFTWDDLDGRTKRRPGGKFLPRK